MELTFQMTGGISVAGKFGTEIHCHAAPLPIETKHRELIRARINIGIDAKSPTRADAGHVDVVVPDLLKAEKSAGWT